jgi:hypothetical protein
VSEEGKESKPRKRRLSRGAKAVVAVAGGILTIATLVFLFFPGLKPPEPCRGERQGELNDLRVDRSVSYADFLELEGEDPGDTSPDALKRIGKLIDFEIAATGYKGKELSVYWTTKTEAGGPLPDSEGMTNRFAFSVRPEDCRDSGRRRVWTPLPSRGGMYIVELTLTDDDDEPLDSERTPTFTT